MDPHAAEGSVASRICEVALCVFRVQARKPSCFAGRTTNLAAGPTGQEATTGIRFEAEGHPLSPVNYEDQCGLERDASSLRPKRRDHESVVYMNHVVSNHYSVRALSVAITLL